MVPTIHTKVFKGTAGSETLTLPGAEVVLTDNEKTHCFISLRMMSEKTKKKFYGFKWPPYSKYEKST